MSSMGLFGPSISLYIAPTTPDLMEFGWTWAVDSQITGCCQSAPTVFALRLYNGTTFYSEDGSNPGAGTLPEASDHKFAIHHNPNGDNPNRYEFKRDGMFFGFLNSDRMQDGGAVYGGAEGWAYPCEDMQSHMWNLQRQTTPGGSWANWNSVQHGSDIGTVWFYYDETETGASAPEWWLKHCAQAYCNDT
jgi:hypothetical protein